MTTSHDTYPSQTPGGAGINSDAASVPTDGAIAVGGSRSPRRAKVALAVAGVALVGSIAGVAAVLSHRDGEPASPTASLTLPPTVQGLSPLPHDSDPLFRPEWRANATVAAGSTAFAAQTYAPKNSKRTMRVVVARTDLTGKLEQGWALDAGTQVGDDRCTQNLQIVKNGKSGIRPTVMLCWHTTSTLSAYVVIIDPQQTVAQADGVAALDEVWKAISA